MSADSKTDSLTEQVIAQVKSRPVLWDKKHEMYGNVQAMDHEWNKMSAVMKRDKEFLKKRWRRVRDVFRIEIKKWNPPENPTKPLLSYYIGVWPHFESMFFLKDSLTKRTPRLFFPDENDETVDALLLSTSNLVNAANLGSLPNSNINTSNIITSTIANTSFVSIPNMISIPNLVIPNQIDNGNCNTVQGQTIEEDSLNYEEEVGVEVDEKPLYLNLQSDWSEPEQNAREPRGVKRKAEDWGVDLDEDVNFAKSIVGFLRKLNPIRKLLVRNEIQSILLRELLCDKCKCKGQQRACRCE